MRLVMISFILPDYKNSWDRAATNHTGTNIQYTPPDTAIDSKTYYFAIRSVNSNGTSHWVNAGPFTPSGVAAPGKPILSMTGRDDGSITVSWNKSSKSNVTYHVVYSDNGRASWSRIRQPSPKQTNRLYASSGWHKTLRIFLFHGNWFR